MVRAGCRGAAQGRQGAEPAAELALGVLQGWQVPLFQPEPGWPACLPLTPFAHPSFLFFLTEAVIILVSKEKPITQMKRNIQFFISC